MEEILASIRKIIADDQALPITPRLQREELPEAYPSPAPIVHAPAYTPPAYAPAAYAPVDAPLSDARLRPPPARPAFDLAGSVVAPPPRPRIEQPSSDIRSFAPPRPPQPMPPRLVEVQAPAPVHAPAHTPAPAPAINEQLLSDQANLAVASAFQALSATRVTMPSTEALDAMAREMLRPMLKQWLEDNLPTMVERLVRAEIERVARGR
jgi:cell pole-organizing protein PopZ